MPSFIFYHSKDEASQKRKWHEENILAHQRDEIHSWKKGLQKGELVVDACEDPDSQSRVREIMVPITLRLRPR